MKKFLITCSLILLLLGGFFASVIAWNWEEISTEAGSASERQLLGRWNGDDDRLEFLKDGVCLVTIKDTLVALEGKYAVDKNHLRIDITTPGKEGTIMVRFEVEGNTMLLLKYADGAKVYWRIIEDG